MAGSYVMAIDAGTGSVRAVIFDTKGNQIGCSQREWTHTEDPRYPGSMNFDWETNWNLAKSCISAVLKETGISNTDIAAISTTCMREGIILYDAQGKEIWACANVDARSTDEVLQLKNMSPALEHDLYLESGQTYSLSAIPRILWVKNNAPEIYKKTAKVGMFNDWLIYKMSGKLIVEPSNGSTNGFFSLATRKWDTTIADRCNLRNDIFPDIQESGTTAGVVSKQAATETGLAEGTPLIVGGGDAQLGTIGVGITQANEGAIFGGSFWQYEYNTDSPKIADNFSIRVNCHVQPNLWQYEALAFKPGLVMRWFRDAFCQEEKKLAKEKNTSTYCIMDEHAAKIPVGSYGMMCTFSDIMDFGSWRHAAPTFTNFELDSDKYNKYTFYRAILENTALITYGHILQIQKATGKLPKTISIGGGVAQSKLWSQIVADVIGLPVRVPVVKEATALGAAMIAATGVGIYKNIDEAAQAMVKIETTLQPDMNNHSLYMKLYDTWRTVYKAQLDLADAGATKYMWAAPGSAKHN
ncbi:MAG: autoinducer-2 kinase [Treponema sp.]|nr:autoinducer-2 kinase [Treponema sp.]